MRLLCPFNSSSVISGRWEDDNESLRTMGPYVRFKRFFTFSSKVVDVMG